MARARYTVALFFWMLYGQRVNGEEQQLLKMTAADEASNDFGFAVAISSDGARVAVVAYGDDDKSGSVYVLDGATGTTFFKVALGSTLGHRHVFGNVVAISSDGTRVAVGAPGDYDKGSDSGSVYVIEGATGTTLLKVTAAEGAPEEFFGTAVAISSDGTRVAVGAMSDVDKGSQSGSVYVLDGATGTTLLKVTAADGEREDFFGSAVAISSDGTRIGVGATHDDDKGWHSGSVYVFDGATGATLLKVTAADRASGDSFGSAVAISSDGSRVAVGASGDDDKGTNSGSVYVFSGPPARRETGWVSASAAPAFVAAAAFCVLAAAVGMALRLARRRPPASDASPELAPLRA